MNYPEVINSNLLDDTLTLELKIDPNLEAFQGHFERFPIIPGVVQVQWALHFFKLHHPQCKNINNNCAINKISALKFQHVIIPNDVVTLTLKFDNNKTCIQFRMQNADHQYSSGKLFIEQTS
jgi:3-hydroxymyristoyl/3-hydroxydecanoyl-(acyl carrier protein) dehydratase